MKRRLSDLLRRPLRSHAALAAIVLTGVVVTVAVVAAARYLPALDDVRELRASVDRIVATVESSGLGIDRTTLIAVRSDFEAASARLDRIERLVKSDPLVAVGRVFPPTAPTIASLDNLAAAAADLQFAGAQAMTLAGRYVDLEATASPAIDLASMAPSSGRLAQLVELLASSQDGISGAADAMERASADLRAASEPLPGPLASLRASLLDRIGRLTPAVAAFRAIATSLPSIAGWSQPRRYLILAEDPAELRPTGGFIGTVGVATFEHGALVGLDFHDVYDFDLRAGVPHVTPPPALRDHLLGDRSWQLADANWSPDFPESAQAAIRLYSLETGDTRIDGVIALTTYAIDDLLRVTGPLEVPDYAVTVRAGETTYRALAATRHAPVAGINRKAFLAEFGSILAGRLTALPVDRWTSLLTQLREIASTRQATAWFADADTEAFVAAGAWGGGLRADRGDYLQVVDANVAPSSKLDVLVDRALRLDVAIDAVGNAHNTLGISWTNGIAGAAGAPYRKLDGFGNTGVLGDFFRVLVPDRSRLSSLKGAGLAPIAGAESIEQVAGREAFGAYLPIGPAGASVSAQWVSPYAADVSGTSAIYRLVVQKQPGTRSDSLGISITLPPGARIVATSPSLTFDGRTARLTTQLTADVDVFLTYSTAAPGATPSPASSQEH